MALTGLLAIPRRSGGMMEWLVRKAEQGTECRFVPDPATGYVRDCYADNRRING
ncbi:hypothetical protein [Spirosoma luteum]|uniref:hypothetical protein n=1 Tax=Spirosoma luteum TaxID=431553 RepID=UPI00036E51C8|nr:hypothetical protein [Spirosoma luteum]